MPQLTQLSLVNLFGRESKHRQQFDHYVNYRLSHSGCGLDLGIGLESTSEVSRHSKMSTRHRSLSSHTWPSGRCIQHYDLRASWEGDCDTYGDEAAYTRKTSFAWGDAWR